ncbi:MAG: type II toxin-antitoxin system RelE/ParE family toxin [bacterium]|nr:type II toxin-antitoxin system RelE/ParE family toxin [bacterium]
MDYDLKWKREAEQDFDRLDTAVQKQALIQFEKLIKSPELGLPLGKKAGLDLTGYRKLYFFQKKYRIVYKLNEKNKKVVIFAIGKREDMKVYREVIKRLER